MQFELTEALLDEIVFAMEDQIGEFFLDTAEGIVTGGPDGFESGPAGETDSIRETRFIPLPEWDSTDGFRLMECFAAGFRNPMIREELSSALGMGRGVFRAFKNVLTNYPEAEKLWFSFKDKEMKKKIFVWYNALREEWGLEKIGIEPEETGDLVLEDFRFRPFREEDLAEAEKLNRFYRDAYRRSVGETGAACSADILLKEALVFFNSSNNIFVSRSDSPAAAAMTAESSGGEFSGYIAGVVKDAALYIQNLEVKAEYRGLGIGAALLSRFIESFDTAEISHVLFDLPFWAEDFSRVLLREFFKPYTVRYCLTLRDRL